MTQRSNPFQPIYDVCNRGNSKEKLANLPAFPRYIDIELTNACNFKCLMCPVGTGSIKRKTGFMSDEIFQQIATQIKDQKTPVRLIRWGEPFLHQQLIPYVKQLTSQGSLVHLNTNGSLLTESVIDQLLEAGLDSLKFSFQGVDRKSYLEMRSTDFFEQLIACIRLLHNKRGNSAKPYIHVSTTITYETAEQVQTFRKRLEPYADLVTVGRTVLDHIDLGKVALSDHEKQLLTKLKKQESVVKTHPECPEVFDKLSINWDGTISACCSDYDHKMLIGDLNAESLADIWKNRQMSHFRNLLAEMQHDKIELCAGCYDYHGLSTPGLQKVD